MRSVANETVFVKVVLQAEAPDPDEVPVPVDEEPVAAVPDPEPVVADPELVPVSPVPLVGVIEPLPLEVPLPLQARPAESEAMVAKARMFDVARCMKTVLSA